MNDLEQIISAGIKWDIVLKVAVTMICSSILGWERTRKRRPAGARTFMLVSLSSCLIGMLGVFVYQEIGNSDPTRLGAQVISGIGFLGAGTIIFNGYHQIKGLTTAAGLWASACIGLSIGIGFIFPACLITAMIPAVMIPLDRIETQYLAKSAYLNVMIVFNRNGDLAGFLKDLNDCNSLKITDMEVINSNTSSSFVFYLMLKLYERSDRMTVLNRIKTANGVDYAEMI